LASGGLGIQHVHIKKHHHTLMEKRNDRISQASKNFYQLIEYVEDADILKCLKERETFLQPSSSQYSSSRQNAK
jgi:hypothetical protein